MLRYRIGRVEGHWHNFVPPIQGGKFRPGVDDSKVVIGVPGDESSSTSQEKPMLPALGSRDLRNRHIGSKCAGAGTSRAPDSMSFIDKHTKAQIDLDHHMYPSLTMETQSRIVRKYRLLDERIRKEGLYVCNYVGYAWECLRYVILASAVLILLRLGWYASSAVFLGLLWHQLVFTVHDAGHMGITHNYQTDTVIGIVIADFIGGLSVCWWKHNHNVHHIVTNSPEHDPDIEHVPFFAISPRFFTSLRSTFYNKVMTYDKFAQWILPYQAYLYYPVLLFGRFNLYYLSWEFILRGTGPSKGPARWHRWLEAIGQVFFWSWFGYGILYSSIPSNWQRLVYVLISHMCTMPVHAQITLSHFSMSTSELGPAESFPQKMLRTTMDIDCPPWLDFLHGGLQFQAIHHLFPRIPRHNLRKAQTLIREFCDEVEIPYALYGFVDGSRGVIGRLDQIAQQAKIFAKCQNTIIERSKIVE